MEITSAIIQEILHIGIELSTEKNRNRLLSKIIRAGMEITDCDAGTLYLFDGEKLHFRIMVTLSMGVDKGSDGEDIGLPPVNMVEENVCAYAAIHREVVNIPDVYNSERFDFSGPKRYDSMTGYRTRSMLVVPLLNRDEELLGVLQLLNARNEAGESIAFAPDYEPIIRAISSLAAIELTNLSYLTALKQQQYSFVEAMTTAIDERTPYNGSHSRKVAEYAALLAEHIEKLHQQGKEEDSFDEEAIERLKLAGLVHDVGKMIVPLSVMNRGTRLDQEMDGIKERFKLLKAYYEIDCLKGLISREEYEAAEKNLQEMLEFIQAVEGAGFLNDENYEKVQKLGTMKYEREGLVLPYLTEEELNRLSVRKGTLSTEDRIQMENHVVMTEKILGRVQFKKPDGIVIKWASEHHEFLDGSGYPKHLQGEEICLETRIITVADVYDALTASDRPYKKPMPKERAFAILHSMAEEGKLEGRLVDYLEAALG